MAIPIIEKTETGVFYEKCFMYAVNYTEILKSGIKKADPSWPIQSCKYGWEFNFTDVPYETVSTEVFIFPFFYKYKIIISFFKYNFFF